MIYFIEAVGAGLVKIGFTERDVQSRVRELQTGCPHHLRVMATVAGDLPDEGEMHRQFAHLRAGGEWFRLDDELRVFTLLAKWVVPRVDELSDRCDAVENRVDSLEWAEADYRRELFTCATAEDPPRSRIQLLSAASDIRATEVAILDDRVSRNEAEVFVLQKSVKAIEANLAVSWQRSTASRSESARSMCGDCQM